MVSDTNSRPVLFEYVITPAAGIFAIVLICDSDN